jgi:putative transposase
MAVLSTGEVIENPRRVRRRALARAQQALAAKTKGSKRRACCCPASQGRPDSPGRTTTSWPDASPATTRRSVCRTWPCPAWPARGRQGQSTTPAGRHRSGCWRRMHYVAGGLWSRSAAGSRPAGCARCSGSTPGGKPLDVRSWTCPQCGATRDHDFNAARNILVEGRRVAAGWRRLSTLVEAASEADLSQRLPVEARTRRGAA